MVRCYAVAAVIAGTHGPRYSNHKRKEIEMDWKGLFVLVALYLIGLTAILVLRIDNIWVYFIGFNISTIYHFWRTHERIQ